MNFSLSANMSGFCSDSHILWLQIITQIVIVCYGFWFIIVLVHNYYADVAYPMGNFKNIYGFLCIFYYGGVPPQ